MLSWKNKKIDKLKSGQNIFSNVTAYAILAVALGSITFFGVCDPSSFRQSGPTGPAVTVGNETIPGIVFFTNYDRMVSQYRQFAGPNFDPSSMRMAETVLNGMVTELVTNLEAKKLGFYLSSDEIEDFIYEAFTDRKTGKFNSDAYTNHLRNQSLSEAIFVEMLSRELLNQKVQQLNAGWEFYSEVFARQDFEMAETKLAVDYVKIGKADAKVSVSPADIEEFLKGDGLKKAEEYYKANTSSYNKPEKTKASHILITHKESRRPSDAGAKRSKDEARAFAESILAQAKSPGSKFEDLAKKHTEDPSGKDKAGDLGFFERSTMTKPFSDAAFSLAKGELSNLVDSEFGFHIIKVTDRQDAVVKSFDAVKNEIAQNLIRENKAPEVLKKRAEAILADIKAGKTAKNIENEYGAKLETSDEFAVQSQSIPGLGSDEKLLEAIASLRSNGEVFPNVLDVGELKVIVRLNRRKPAPEIGRAHV